jgi:hypothetical protein
MHCFQAFSCPRNRDSAGGAPHTEAHRHSGRAGAAGVLSGSKLQARQAGGPLGARGSVWWVKSSPARVCKIFQNPSIAATLYEVVVSQWLQARAPDRFVGFTRCHLHNGWCIADMDPIPACDLFQLLFFYGSPEHEVARIWMEGIARAVLRMHGLGVLHNDIKPENLLVRHNHSLRLTDFGYAFAPTPATLNGAPILALESNHFFGTPEYSHPRLQTKQQRGSTGVYRYTNSTDLFSMLCVFCVIVDPDSPGGTFRVREQHWKAFPALGSFVARSLDAVYNDPTFEFPPVWNAQLLEHLRPNTTSASKGDHERRV